MRLHGALESWHAWFFTTLALAPGAGCESEQGAARGPRERGVRS